MPGDMHVGAGPVELQRAFSGFGIRPDRGGAGHFAVERDTPRSGRGIGGTVFKVPIRDEARSEFSRVGDAGENDRRNG